MISPMISPIEVLEETIEDLFEGKCSSRDTEMIRAYKLTIEEFQEAIHFLEHKEEYEELEKKFYDMEG